MDDKIKLFLIVMIVIVVLVVSNIYVANLCRQAEIEKNLYDSFETDFFLPDGMSVRATIVVQTGYMTDRKAAFVQQKIRNSMENVSLEMWNRQFPPVKKN